MELTQDENGVRITYRWFGFDPLKHLFMLAFSVVWIGFLVNWYSIALRRPDPEPMMIWFPLGHVAVGVVVSYVALAGLLNRTHVRVGQGWLSFQHGPLPWPAPARLAFSDIRQVYCEERQGRSGSQYQLCAIGPDGGKIALLRWMDSLDVVRFLERRIERAIGIEDRPVEGEIQK